MEKTQQNTQSVDCPLSTMKVTKEVVVGEVEIIKEQKSL